MLTNRQLKEYASLDQAKGRRKAGMFVAEGSRCVGELLPVFKCRELYATREWLDKNADSLPINTTEISRAELRALSRLTTPQDVICFFELPEVSDSLDSSFASGNLVLALDRVQDPGNLGTIIRTCDWMGVHHIVASIDTVDSFSPKVVQATMGALARVVVRYVDLKDFIMNLPTGVPVYGTFLDGENIYSEPLSKSGILIMGNEGNGISPEIETLVNKKLLIPSYPTGESAVESLNVGTATAIALSQFRSRLFSKLSPLN